MYKNNSNQSSHEILQIFGDTSVTKKLNHLNFSGSKRKQEKLIQSTQVPVQQSAFCNAMNIAAKQTYETEDQQMQQNNLFGRFCQVEPQKQYQQNKNMKYNTGRSKSILQNSQQAQLNQAYMGQMNQFTNSKDLLPQLSNYYNQGLKNRYSQDGSQNIESISTQSSWFQQPQSPVKVNKFITNRNIQEAELLESPSSRIQNTSYGQLYRKSDTDLQFIHKANNSPKIKSPPIFKNPFFKRRDQEQIRKNLNIKINEAYWMEYQAYIKFENNLSRYRMDFKEIKQIGLGSFSHVYQVTHRLDGCSYAVKKSSYPVQNSSKRQKWLQEIQVMSMLGPHQNIVRYHTSWIEPDIRTGGDLLFIQLELCKQSLGSLVKKHAEFTENELFKIIRQIGHALQLCHNKGVVHLDIKPENIYTTEQGDYKLGDFGMSTMKNGALDVQDGDSRYLSQELLNDDYNDLPKSDIFALGATIYELAIKENLPRRDIAYQDLRKGVIQELPRYTQKLHQLLELMMHEDPDRRPSPQQLLDLSEETL